MVDGPTFCTQCGAQLQAPGVRFCHWCGAPAAPVRGRLDAPGPAASGESRRGISGPRLLVGGTVIVGAVLVFVALRAGGEDGERASPPDAASDHTAGAISLVPPDGWAVGPNGLVVAEREQDLTGPTERGRARLELEPDAREPADILAEAQALDIQVLDDPEEIEMAGHPALGVTLQETSAGTTTVRRYVLVSPEAGVPFTLIMESSPERWEGLQPRFEQVRARILVGPSPE